MSDLLTQIQAALAGRYRIERELDRGGMAAIYVAEDLKHPRKVAIKVVLPAVADTLGSERFLREIAVLARLQHPNILTLIDSGEAGGLPFYVMPYVEGQSLRHRLDTEGTLSLDEAIRLAAEVADALDHAHRQGVIHRDIKPSNILLSDGHAVVADFGIAAALQSAGVDRLTRTGSSLGSPLYMSPEQMAGERDVGPRSDVYSLACVLYEALGGRAPFADSSLQSLVGMKMSGTVPPLNELRPELPAAVADVLSQAMNVDAEERFSTPRAFMDALQTAQPPSVASSRRSRRTTAAIAVLGAAAVATIVWQQTRVRANQRVLDAASQRAEIQRLSEEDRYTEALELAEKLEGELPGDSALASLLSRFSAVVPVETDPPGARVYRQRVDAPDDEWTLVGVTPLESMRLVRPSAYRVRFELEGHAPVELLHVALARAPVNPLDTVRMDPDTLLPSGMVRIPGSDSFGDFFMDRSEVTNEQYKRFVDAGGYEDPSLWDLPAMVDGRQLAWDDLRPLLVDRTGRPGPSTWRLGTYPDGQENHPVSGVSWHEASAYARFVGKELPTVQHWRQATSLLQWDGPHVFPASNLPGDQPREVGQRDGMVPLGVYDLVGNVREWMFNEAEAGRATLGGAWTDGPYQYDWVLPKSALDRDQTNGVRLIRSFDSDAVTGRLRAPVEPTVRRDFLAEVPASDREFEIFRRMYAYDPIPLNVSVDAVDTFPQWIRETVTFDLSYGERGGAYLYLPLSGSRPLRTVIVWGGSGVLTTDHPDGEFTQIFDFLVTSGSAAVLPMFKGAYGRDDAQFSTNHPDLLAQSGSTTYRQYQLDWINDFSRTIDYLETREDLATDPLGYYGFSWGGLTAPIALTVDERIDAAVLHVGGLGSKFEFLPEIDPINFITRVDVPVLMLNGAHDVTFPYETDQRPMFELWGTDPEHKEHITSESGHWVPADQLARETLNWFDRYLPVGN